MTAPDPSVSPGIGGFIAFFLLGCALWLLMRNMVTRLRNVDRNMPLEDEEREADRRRPTSTRPTSPRPDDGDAGRSSDARDGDALDPAVEDQARGVDDVPDVPGEGSVRR